MTNRNKKTTADLQGKEAEFHSLFASDDKGRKIGVRIIKGWIDVVPMDGSEPRDQGACTLPTGRHYAFEPHATRDGEPFGPLQRTQFFQTAEERDKAAEDYLDRAFKRAMKKTGKVGA